MKKQKYLLLLAAILFSACHETSKENSETTRKLSSGEFSPATSAPETQDLVLSSKTPSETANKKKPASTSYQFKAIRLTDSLKELQISSVLQPISEQVVTTPEPLSNTLQDIYRQLEKPGQVFTFSGQQDTVLIGSEGTKIVIPADAFVLESTGKPVMRPVQLKLTEYYSTADILLANLTTKSGSEMLETGGMLYLEAYAGDEKLKLQDGKVIGLHFPTAKPKAGMQLFNGTWENKSINWTPEVELHDNRTVKQKTQKIKFKSNEPKFAQGGAALARYIKKYPFPEKRPKKKKKAHGRYEFIVSTNGSISDITVVKKVDPVLDRAAVYMIANMPKWKPGKEFSTEVPKVGTISIDFNSVKIPKTLKAMVAARETEERSRQIQPKYAPKVTVNRIEYSTKIKESDFNDLNKVNAFDVSAYTLSSTKLGWINCDRFLNNNQPKFQYTIKNLHHEEIDLKLVFHKYKAILTGYLYPELVLIPGVPANEKVTVVAIKKVETKLYLATQEIITSGNELPVLAYEEVTLVSLKQALQKLNNLSD